MFSINVYINLKGAIIGVLYLLNNIKFSVRTERDNWKQHCKITVMGALHFQKSLYSIPYLIL